MRRMLVLVLLFVMLAVSVVYVSARSLWQEEEPDPGIELSGAGVAAVVAAITSLLLAYIPNLSGWWGKFTYKREVLGLLGLVVTAALVGLHYAGALDLGLGPFGWPVVWRALEAWLQFAGAGQLAYTAQNWLKKKDTPVLVLEA